MGTPVVGWRSIHYLCVRELGFRPYGGSLFPTAEKVTKKAVLLVWPLLRRGSFTPVPLRGPAPNGHPCPDGALAASMRLGPLRETCVQPAPKSRLAVFELFVSEDQKQIKGFPAEAGPTVTAVFVGLALAGKRPDCSLSVCGVTIDAFPAEAGPTGHRVHSVGPASARNGRGASTDAYPRGAWARSAKPILQDTACIQWDRL
jgi:hypothetical protein